MDEPVKLSDRCVSTVDRSSWDLCRFRIDPRKARVSLGRYKGAWSASIASRAKPNDVTTSYGATPRAAIFRALHLAERRGVEGVDLSMGWSLHHPFGPAGVRARAGRSDPFGSDGVMTRSGWWEGKGT